MQFLGGMRSQLLTSSEAAAKLRVKPHALRRYVRRGLLPKVKLSSRLVLFRESDLEKLINRSMVSITPQ